MDGWTKAASLPLQTPQNELSLILQGLLFELHAGNLKSANTSVSYAALFGDFILVLNTVLYKLNFSHIFETKRLSFQEVKCGLLNLYKICGDETKLQIKWCQLAVLSLNAMQVQCIFNPSPSVYTLGTVTYFHVTFGKAQRQSLVAYFIVFRDTCAA